MKMGTAVVGLVASLFVVGGGALSCRNPVQSAQAEGKPAPSAEARPPQPPQPGSVPVLVELFTSEGCSSCPPADAELAHLERTQPVRGAYVIPLGFHVDYWDNLGWTDTFSSELATARQHGYASALGSDTYTPQAVVDGRTEMIGSRAALVERAIGEAARRAHVTVAVDVRPDAQTGEFHVDVRTAALPKDAADADVVVALTQAKARVAVASGENAGSTLEHTAIVRDLRILGSAKREGATLSSVLKPPKGIDARDLRVVAFVQERARRGVIGAATPTPLAR